MIIKVIKRIRLDELLLVAVSRKDVADKIRLNPMCLSILAKIKCAKCDRI